MSDFARNQLLKYGWTEGKGLGKNESGIVNAIKPTLKFDTTGVGHEHKEYNWWDYVYNKAASNLSVEKNEGEVKVKVKDKNAVKIKSSKPNPTVDKLKEENGLMYSNFIKTAKFEDGKTTAHKDFKMDMTEVNDDLLANVITNDEDLFRACNGRTAHKGARHGLTLNGKLERIKRQESLLVNNITMNHDDWIKVEKKKKKKHRKATLDNNLSSVDNNNTANFDINSNSNNNNNNSEINIDANVSTNGSLSLKIDDEDYSRPKSKKHKKREKRKLDDLSQQLENSLDISQKKLKRSLEPTNVDCIKSKKKKSLPSKEIDNNSIDCAKISETNRLNGKIKKKKMKKLEKKNNKKMKLMLEGMKTLDIKKEIQN